MSVNVATMPAWMRGKRFIPIHPPIFDTATPSHEDIALAVELLEALDDESRIWFGGAKAIERLKARL